MRRWFGPMPGRREAQAMAWVAIAIGVILCGVSVRLGLQGRSFLGRPLGGDFVEFYTVGKVLNNYAPALIYDLELETSLQHASQPSMPDTQMLIFAHTPFIASLFRPFALLPYAWAYVAWLVFSAGLYLAALALLFRTVRLNADDRKTGFLLALSSTPFLFETWIGGQMSVVVFAIWVLFFWCLDSDRRVLAGFVLALCLSADAGGATGPDAGGGPPLARGGRSCRGRDRDGVAIGCDGGSGWLPGLVRGFGDVRESRLRRRSLREWRMWTCWAFFLSVAALSSGAGTAGFVRFHRHRGSLARASVVEVVMALLRMVHHREAALGCDAGVLTL